MEKDVQRLHSSSSLRQNHIRRLREVSIWQELSPTCLEWRFFAPIKEQQHGEETKLDCLDPWNQKASSFDISNVIAEPVSALAIQ